MCGRFTLQIPLSTLIEIFGISEFPSFALESRFNIAPTQQISVVRQYSDYSNHLDTLRWGLIPSWAKELQHGAPLINARCETIADKPAFRHPIRYHRCLIPADGFYEWRQEGDQRKPMYVHLKDRSPMVFAGVWDAWTSPEGQTIESCSILTTSSNSLIAPLHDRIPVILHPSEYSYWLDRDQRDPEKLKRLYEPFPDDLMEMYPVSPLVNSPNNDTPDLVVPYI